MTRRYTPEMDAWLEERYPQASNRELREEFAERFGQEITGPQLVDWACRRGVRKPVRVHWDEARNGFMRSIIPGHTEQEIRDAFQERFGEVLTESQIGNAKRRLGIKSGTTGGRFERGHVPANKGKTWDEMGVSPEAQARSRATCFKKGDLPHNAKDKPVGYERVSRDGYVEVKVRDGRQEQANENFRPKHHLVWEEANGQPVPPSTMIVFANGNKRDFDPANLVAVPRSLWAVISREGIPYSDRETLETAMSFARLKSGLHEAQTRERACGACGRTYKPRYQHQRTCDACLAAGIRAPRARRSPAAPPASRAKGGDA